MPSISCSICSSARRGSRRPTSRPQYSPSSATGSTPISIVNCKRSALTGQLAEIELGVPTGTISEARIASAYQPPSAVANGLVEHRLAADALQYQRRGHLALAKPGQFQLAPEPAGGALEARLDLRGRYLHVHAHARVRAAR